MFSIHQRHFYSWMLILALTLILHSAAAQAQDGGAMIGVVKARGGRPVWVVAVPPFQNKGGQNLPSAINDIITNDLVLSGNFAPPANPQFVANVNQLDLAKGTVQTAEWNRIGVLYVLKGSYRIDGDKLVTEFMLYDTNSPQGYICGKRYDHQYSVSELRRQAHRISDDVFERITGQPGIASTKICYVRNNDAYGNSKQVMVMDSDGFGAHPVIPGGALVAAPCWGSNATEIYYTTWRDFNPDLEGVILSSGQRWWISRHVNLNISPDWSEKRQLIALTLSKDGNAEIYSMKRNGLDLRRMTDNRAIDSSPCWSPDGSKLAFTSDRTGSKQLYVMDAATLSANRITFNNSSDNDGASWGPGTSLETNRIVFHSLKNGVYQICTMNPDGSDERQLTTGSRNEDPCWAPNGHVIIFTSDRNGESQLFSMYADGSNVHQLSKGQPSHSARWSPVLP